MEVQRERWFPLLRSRELVALSGVALGYGLAVGAWPGGYDALTFYFKAPFPGTTAPGWVYLLTYPFSFLPWPLGWQVWTAISAFVLGITAWLAGNKRWWGVLVSTPFVWNAWLGQIEVLPAAGVLLTLLVITRRLRPVWLGVSWLALLSKPQVGMGALVLQALWWITEEQRPWHALLPAIGVAVGIILLSVGVWPHWMGDWVRTLRGFRATWWNASIWPYGLLAWPGALFLATKKASVARTRLRLLTAASLLGSPYFALYHATTLLTLTEDRFAFLLSWLIPWFGRGLPEHWMKWGWLLPGWVLAVDVFRLICRSPKAAG